MDLAERFLLLCYDDYLPDLYLRRPRYGGGPSLLGDPAVLSETKRRLAAGSTCRSVAKWAGYSDAQAFQKAFVRETGQLPGAFAREARAKLAAEKDQ